MSRLFGLLIALTTALTAVALPAPLDQGTIKRGATCPYNEYSSKLKACDTVTVPLPVPAAQTELVVPAGEHAFFVGLARGVQNYTCVNGAWSSIGALADLYDITCIAQENPNHAGHLPAIAFPAIPFPNPGNTDPPVAVKHEFVVVPEAAGGSPRFFVAPGSPLIPSATPKEKNFVGTKTGSIPSPDGPENVAWLKVDAFPAQGTFAKTVFRINTVKGQPPAGACSGNEAISVPYGANYWFFK